MRQRNHAAAPVSSEALHHIVRHFAGDGDIRYRPGTPVFFARIAHGDGKSVEQSHGGQVLGELTGTDQQHAVLRPEGVHQLHLINAEFGGRIADLHVHAAVDQQGRALHQLALFKRQYQLVQLLGVRVKFQQQLQCAAARQTEAMRFIRCDTVFHPVRRAAGNDRCFTGGLSAGVSLSETVNQIVFNTTARHRTDHCAGFAQRHDGAYGAGR